MAKCSEEKYLWVISQNKQNSHETKHMKKNYRATRQTDTTVLNPVKNPEADGGRIYIIFVSAVCSP